MRYANIAGDRLTNGEFRTLNSLPVIFLTKTNNRHKNNSASDSKDDSMVVITCRRTRKHQRRKEATIFIEKEPLNVNEPTSVLESTGSIEEAPPRRRHNAIGDLLSNKNLSFVEKEAKSDLQSVDSIKVIPPVSQLQNRYNNTQYAYLKQRQLVSCI